MFKPPTTILQCIIYVLVGSACFLGFPHLLLWALENFFYFINNRDAEKEKRKQEEENEKVRKKQEAMLKERIDREKIRNLLETPLYISLWWGRKELRLQDGKVRWIEHGCKATPIGTVSCSGGTLMQKIMRDWKNQEINSNCKRDYKDCWDCPYMQ